MESQIFRFGLFRLDAATRELRREDSLVHLQAQPAQVLLCLVERAGEVVSREELRQAIWGNETFVDFDRGLNFCLAQIRSALGDDPTRPVYIRTLPKRGYQFIAPVERVSSEVSAANGAAYLPRRSTMKTALTWASVFVALIAGSLLIAAKYRSSSTATPAPTPILAVARFDNETGNPELTRFSDGLTDTVVEQLTSQSNGRYRVIGNAQILRLPREQRDLTAINASLHAGYVVLGQVQRAGEQTRILAHLIRLPDQTHIRVVRVERTLADPMGLESEVAQKIGAAFSAKLAAEANSTASSSAANH